MQLGPGARTNTEGREHERRDADRQDPDWGFHRDEFRLGSHHIDVEIPVESVMTGGCSATSGDVVQSGFRADG